MGEPSHRSSNRYHDDSNIEPMPHGDYVESMRIVENREGQIGLLVKNEIGLKFYIHNLSMLPSYAAAFQDEVMLGQYQIDTHNEDFERVYNLLIRRHIILSGNSNGNRLLNISDPELALPATHGLLYFNSRYDKHTYGKLVRPQVPHVSLPMIQVHIEERQVDRRGRTTNNLRLLKNTLYLVK